MFSVEQREDVELIRAVVEVHFPLVRARSRLEPDLRRHPVATAQRANRDGAAVLQGRIANDECHPVAARRRRDRLREGRSAVGARALALAGRLVLVLQAVGTENRLLRSDLADDENLRRLRAWLLHQLRNRLGALGGGASLGGGSEDAAPLYTGTAGGERDRQNEQ